MHSGNLELVVLTGIITFITWVLIGAFLVYHAQNKMEQWYEWEKFAHDQDQLEKLQSSYDKVFQKYQAGGENPINYKKLESVRYKMEYLIMRLIFINPMSLPAMTESYLRRDFHFAMYLGYCYGKVLVKFFKWSLSSTLILFGIIIFVNLIFTIMADEMIDQLMRFICFLTAFIMLICMKSCLTSAEKKLVPSIFVNVDEEQLIDPENFNINLNKNGIDPFNQFSELPKMQYLDLDDPENSNLDDEDRDKVNNDEERQ